MKTLIIIDMQQEMQNRLDSGRDHVNGDASARITALAEDFRGKGRPVIHVRHRDENPQSPFHPDASGYQPLECDHALEGEAIFLKRTSSAFASTNLEAHLRDKGLTNLIVTGAVAGFCVNSTVRAGADLGFNMTVVRDAVLGFDLPQAGLSARTIFDVTMAHLDGDFASLVETSAVLAD